MRGENAAMMDAILTERQELLIEETKAKDRYHKMLQLGKGSASCEADLLEAPPQEDLQLTKQSSSLHGLNVKPKEDKETILRLTALKKQLNNNVALVDLDQYEASMMANKFYVHDFDEINWLDPFPESEKAKKYGVGRQRSSNASKVNLGTQLVYDES